MTTDIVKPKAAPKRPRKVKNLGKLHALLIRGLPDWIDEDGLLKVYDLAKQLGVSYQSVYAFLGRERVPPKRMNALIKLSEESEKISGDFKALSHSDFADFLE